MISTFVLSSSLVSARRQRKVKSALLKTGIITDDSTISLGLVYDNEINASFEEDESDDLSKVSSPRWTLGAFSAAEFFALRNSFLICFDVVKLKPFASNVTMVFAFWRVWFEEIRLLRFFSIVLGN